MRIRPWTAICPATSWVSALGAIAGSACQPSADDYIAERIIIALAPVAGERAIVRYDPNSLPDLPEALSSALEVRAVDVDLMRYGAIPDFDARLDAADIYVWLPDPTGEGTTPTQRAALAEWLDEGRGRQIHFHWSAGTMGADGVPGEHSSFYDERYLEALGIDYQELDRHQDAAITVLRTGPIRVTTPAGTDITFEIGARPFNKQNGDASSQRMESARIRIDREIELPAGVVRVAPMETTVNGTVVVPHGRFAGGEVSGLIMRFEGGVMTAVSATSGEAIARAAFEDSPALRHFRELGIGFNPALKPLPSETWIPYFGYGEGVVRLSLGNNHELGGNVGGDGVRWFLFGDATVAVGGTILVERGELVLVPHLSGLGLLGLLER